MCHWISLDIDPMKEPVVIKQMEKMSKEFYEYSETNHAYYADGRHRISVTQVLDKCGLISPFCKDEEAMQRGSEVHRLCAIDDIKGVDFRKIPVELRGYVRAWRRYRKETGFIPELIEHRIDDALNGYAGRLDRFGQGIVLDLKTSTTGAIAEYVRYQLTAYAQALKPNRIYRRIAVSLMPNGNYKCKVYDAADFIADRSQWFMYLKQAKEL